MADLSRGRAWFDFYFEEITLATLFRMAWLGRDQGLALTGILLEMKEGMGRGLIQRDPVTCAHGSERREESR